tara:strand:- start:101036 stop:101614 length:579 start_codon:yes stop_codon:yes gene_type:complete
MTDNLLTLAYISDILKSDRDESLEVLSELERLGFIEKLKSTAFWILSVRGQLYLAKNAPKLFKPKSMKVKLNELVARMDKANTSDKFTDHISVAKITSEFPIINKSRGVKIIYTLKSRKLTDHERRKRESLIRNEHKGKWDNLPQYFGYQQMALNSFLKSRSQILKLRVVSENEFELTEGKIIFELKGNNDR